MDKPQIKFGDKLFLYGHYLDENKYEDLIVDDSQYNSVLGYMTTGGYYVTAVKTSVQNACVPGFVGDYLQGASLTFETPFDDSDLVDVTDILALQAPLMAGCRVWMPVPYPRFNIL